MSGPAVSCPSSCARLTTDCLWTHRGTKDFAILVSNDGTAFTEVLSGTLASVANKGCNVPTEEFYLGGDRTERYVRLVLKTYHGVGSGMQWIGLEQKAAPAPAGALECECSRSASLFFFMPVCPVVMIDCLSAPFQVAPSRSRAATRPTPTTGMPKAS